MNFSTSNTHRIPIAIYLMKWVLPISLALFLITAIGVPAYESQVGYIVSMWSFFFLILNVAYSWIASIYYSMVYSMDKTVKSKTLNLLLGVVFNIWGQYHFIMRMPEPTRRNKIGVYEIFYLSIIFIICNVTYMMSLSNDYG